MSKGLAIVVAHPDDDTWGMSGTVALHGGDPDFELTVVLATSGDAGEIADPSLASPEILGTVREEESRRSWSALGVEPARLEFLRYRDGHLAEAPREEVVKRISAVLRETRPDVVATFGPEGITAHEDHIAVGEAATDAFHRIREEGGEGLVRLLYGSLRQGELDRFSRMMVAAGMDPIDPTQPFAPRGVPDETIAVVVDTSSVWKRKRAALLEHKTQEDGQGFPDEAWPEILGSEAFVQAWPEREPGSPVLDSVFQGIA